MKPPNNEDGNGNKVKGKTTKRPVKKIHLKYFFTHKSSQNEI